MKKTLIALLAALTLLAAVPQVSFADNDLPTPPPVEDGEEEKGEKGEKGDDDQTPPPDDGGGPGIKPLFIDDPMGEI